MPRIPFAELKAEFVRVLKPGGRVCASVWVEPESNPWTTIAMDAIATEQIKQSLDEIKQGRTVIIISHSLSQIIDADYTYVMKDGRIAEHGEHDALYHQNGVYKEIFDAMAKSLNIEKIAKTYEDDAEEETHS